MSVHPISSCMPDSVVNLTPAFEDVSDNNNEIVDTNDEIFIPN